VKAHDFGGCGKTPWSDGVTDFLPGIDLSKNYNLMRMRRLMPIEALAC
jgi:hypothetical protein